MYISVDELAEYLRVTPEYIRNQIKLGNIVAVHDGHDYLLNKAQFVWHHEQIRKRILQWKEEQLEPLPEDIDVKDED